MDREIVKSVVTEVLKGYLEAKADRNSKVPVAVSNRHVHLSSQDLYTLFGDRYDLKKLKDLSQPGQFAAKECLTLVGPSGVKTNVRVLGPCRGNTQVEISRTDGFELGIKPPVRDSGDITGTPGIVIVGPAGAVTLKEGVICASRHIHMPPQDAERIGVSDKQYVKVRVGGERGLIFDKVLIRVSSKYALEMHVDIDEANAAFINNGDMAEVLLG